MNSRLHFGNAASVSWHSFMLGLFLISTLVHGVAAQSASQLDFGRLGVGGGTSASGGIYKVESFTGVQPEPGGAQSGDYTAVSVLSIAPDPAEQPVEVITPNGGETFDGGESIDVQWRTDTDTAGTDVSIELWRDDRWVQNLVEDGDAGGSHTTTVILPRRLGGDDFRIRVRSLLDPDLYDQSDAPFTIEADTTPNAAEGATWRGYR